MNLNNKQKNQMIADLLLKPILELIDTALALDSDLVEYCKALIKSMCDSLSTAQTVAGMLVPLELVNKRQVEYETFKVFVELIIQRNKQREKTIELAKQQTDNDKMKQALGF